VPTLYGASNLDGSLSESVFLFGDRVLRSDLEVVNLLSRCFPIRVSRRFSAPPRRPES